MIHTMHLNIAAPTIAHVPLQHELRRTLPILPPPVDEIELVLEIINVVCLISGDSWIPF